MDKSGGLLPQGVVAMPTNRDVEKLGLAAVALSLDGGTSAVLPLRSVADSLDKLRPIPVAELPKVPVTRRVSGMARDVPMAGEWMNMSNEEIILSLVRRLQPGDYVSLVALLLVQCTYPVYQEMMDQVDEKIKYLAETKPKLTAKERGLQALQLWAQEKVSHV